MEEIKANIMSSAVSATPALSFNLNKTLDELKTSFKKLIKSADILLLGIFEKMKSMKENAPVTPGATSNVGYSERSAFTPNRKKKMLRVYGLITIVILLLASFFLGRLSVGNTTSSFADSRPNGPSIQAQQVLNKDFSFPLLDAKGVKVSTIKYKITTIDQESSIIVNGQRATAVKGRTFLVINLEITNNHTQGIQINSKDYVRLQVNGRGDWIAADIHNDPVTVQAISTKITRLGFPINDTDKNLTLQIGEITGEKQFVKLNLERK